MYGITRRRFIKGLSVAAVACVAPIRYIQAPPDGYYSIATIAECEAGIDNHVYMTPAKVKQAIDRYAVDKSQIWLSFDKDGQALDGIAPRLTPARLMQLIQNS